MAPCTLSTGWLTRRLATLAPADADGRYLVAFSGGLDSSVLLHAVAAVAPGRTRALHVHHGLHPDAESWSRHAARECERLGVPCEIRLVDVARAGSVEAEARAVRYAALAEALNERESLLTAHHQDDQLETVLLQLLRGAGPAGLAAMPATARFGSGWHLRPFLDLRRELLRDYARAHDLDFLRDPGNRDRRFDRNYLRHEVLPALRERWPSAATSVARSAALCGEADALLTDLARLDAGGDLDDARLDLEPLASLSAARYANALRGWLRAIEQPLPNRARLVEFARQLRSAADDRQPALHYADTVLRAYRGGLYACRADEPTPDGFQGRVDAGSSLRLPGGLGTLRLEARIGAGVAARHAGHGLAVGFRAGGEALRLRRAGSSTTLKKLMAQSGLLPWRRGQVPLLWAHGRLAAVGDLWHDADLAAAPDEEGFVVVWDGRPTPLFARELCANRGETAP